MKDAYSFDLDDAGLERSYQVMRDAYERIFARLGLEYVIVKADAGAMGGSKSEEFLHPIAVGEDTFVRRPAGTRPTSRLHVTPVPEAKPVDGLPEPVLLPASDTPTIDSLVAHANAVAPRDGAPWTAADTLKNVVLALTHLDGTREIVVVGLPGDRDVDLKRAEVAFAPAEVEAAGDADFGKHPGLVKGYIGPQVLGADSATGLRYFVDPRVVDGTTWVTGANERGVHVSGLVAGRDFVADGVVEVAQVREGDPAPDGSGPIETARGMEIGHVFQLGRKYAEALGLKVLDENGKQVDRHDGLVRHRRDPHPGGHRRGEQRRQGPGLAGERRPVRRARRRDRQGRRRLRGGREARRRARVRAPRRALRRPAEGVARRQVRRRRAARRAAVVVVGRGPARASSSCGTAARASARRVPVAEAWALGGSARILTRRRRAS